MEWALQRQLCAAALQFLRRPEAALALAVVPYPILSSKP